LCQNWHMNKSPFFLCLFLVACAHAGGSDQSYFDLNALPRGLANSTHKSGYALGGANGTALCGIFPKVQLGTRAGYCVGMVASKEDGLVFPRTILQVPGTRFFVVADMGSWNPNQGRLLLLDPEAAVGKRIKVLIAKLDAPHGLQLGIDGKLYVGTIDAIFRFDPLSNDPSKTIERVLQNLPGRNVTLPDGTIVEHLAHPLKNFIFDRTGRIFVNIGSPTDACLGPSASAKGCEAGEGAAPLAAIYLYTPPPSGVFPALKKGEKNPKFEVYARGLRNSMALAAHPKFPDPGFAFMQGENARDIPDPMDPNEELNALEQGRHYGWPYCYNNQTVSGEYANFIASPAAGKLRDLCGQNPLYKKPFSLMPPHVAPLGMLYYQGTKFPELTGQLIVTWHGYRPTGSRVVFYSTDEKGFPPVHAAPVNYKVSCAPEPTRAYQESEGVQVAAAPFSELIGEWHKVNGVRPQGAPVGISVADDGAIWLVEDKNQTILRIDRDSTAAGPALACDSRGEIQLNELMTFIAGDKNNRLRLTHVRTGLVEKHCVGCHADFGLKPNMNDGQKDAAVARFMLSQDSWVYPGDPDSSRMHRRLWGLGAEKQMPADGADLIAHDPSYKALLQEFDQLVLTMVPGDRKRIRLQQSPSLKFVSNREINCGSLPANTVVIVIEGAPKEKPGFVRIYRPADRYLNGQCADSDGYYVNSKYIGAY
jgi:glucose/arabinose dehydrogenase